MQLSEAGQSRLNGYLFVLQRSLSPSMKSDVVADAVREIESHLRDRVEAAQPVPDERSSLEQILMELGPPCGSRRRTPRSGRSTRRSQPGGC